MSAPVRPAPTTPRRQVVAATPATAYMLAVMSGRGCLALLIAGCQGDASPYPPGLEPLPDDAGPARLSMGRIVDLVVRPRAMDGVQVEGRGFVLAPPAAVWAAAHDSAALVARCSQATHTITYANEPEYELSFLIHYVVA